MAKNRKSSGLAGSSKQSKKKSTRKAVKTKDAAKSATNLSELAMKGLAAGDASAIAATRANAVAHVEAESLAFAGFFGMVAARSNRLNKSPVCYQQLSDNSWLICLLQTDGTYGQCRPYNGPVPGPICGG